MSVSVEGVLVAATDKAIKVDIDGEQHWFPRSQVEIVEGGDEIDDDIIIDVPAWLAEQKGL